jgi:hypothetical protein
MTAPMQLPTAASRRRRLRLNVTLIAVGLAVAALFTWVTVRAITRPGAQVTLGDDTFRVGQAAPLARRIARDDYPLLFQDLRDKSIDVFVDHDRAAAPTAGWHAFEAHAPGAPRRCQLRWSATDRSFTDPCDGTRYPADGSGLRAFRVVVSHGVVIVDLRRQISPTSSLGR